MIVWEYAITYTQDSLQAYGRSGWEVYHVATNSSDRYEDHTRWYLRRRRDTYCEACAQAASRMTALERVTT